MLGDWVYWWFCLKNNNKKGYCVERKMAMYEDTSLGVEYCSLPECFCSFSS